MADTAFEQLFRKETIKGFEVHQALTRDMVTTETMTTGSQTTFLVADSGGASAVTRGADGRIPSRRNNFNQIPVVLEEWHDKVEETRFNIFKSQANQRDVMQRTTRAVVNRKVDDDIISVLNTATINTGAATTADLDLVLQAFTILQNNNVAHDNEIFALVTPAFHAYLLKDDSYRSADYVTVREVENMSLAWNETPKFKNWLGVNWRVHPSGLPGNGTNAEKCFMFHKSAIGHAFDPSDLNTAIGYNSEDDYSYCRVSAFMGSALLQNSGIVVMNHDGSALAPA